MENRAKEITVGRCEKCEAWVRVTVNTSDFLSEIGFELPAITTQVRCCGKLIVRYLSREMWREAPNDPPGE